MNARPLRAVLLGLGIGLAALSGAHHARAEADTFGLGRGLPTLTTLSGAQTINSYAAVTSNAAGGTRTIVVDDTTGFVVGGAVMVWQATGLTTTSGDGGDINLTTLNAPVGRYEFARVEAVDTNEILLTNPLVNPYAANVSQVVTVPEYGALTIDAGATILPAPWDGTKGGILAFFATGTVTNNGTIVADRSGFRGGITRANGGPDGCLADDGLPPNGYASKGEGIDPAGYSLDPSLPSAVGGRGNRGNGAGGGDCHNSGGGGGGNASAGGKGGRTWTSSGSADVGGKGGAALVYSALERLTFGGGGGAGDQNGNGPAFDGGAGGGVIYFRAAQFVNNGVVSSNGGTPGDTDNDAASGGGAGGTIVIRVATSATCTGTITARGGNGGNPDFINHGPGAGGGSGRVLLQALSSTCTIDTSTGVAGIQTNPTATDGPHYGATPISSVAGTPETPPQGGFGPLDCAVGINNCGGCVDDSFCGGNAPSCRLTTHTCACATNTECAVTPTTPICEVSSGVCFACNGNASSNATHPCGSGAPFCNIGTGVCATTCFVDADCGTGNFCNNITTAGTCQPLVPNGNAVPGGACTAPLAVRACVSGACDSADNLCGIAFDHGTCAANAQCRAGVCVGSGANTGQCKTCSTNAQCSGGTAVCLASTNACVQCTTAEAAACTGTTPVCGATNTCVGCDGDFGSGTTSACPSTTNPYCGSTQACGRCTSNTDCVGHAGPICNLSSGACGTTCTLDVECAFSDWCSSGTCTPKTPNGISLPNATPINGECSLSNGVRVCSSGVCETGDDLCGRQNGSTCANPAQCRSVVCTPIDGTCGALNGTPCMSATTCRSAVCNGDGLCGDPNGTACTAATTCRSGICQNGQCGTNCATDSECAASDYCSATTHQCLPDAPNGTRPEAMNCDRAGQCVSAVCGSDGACGQLDGGSCTATVVCRGTSACSSGTCNATCATDVDCASTSFCDDNSRVCASDYPNGGPTNGSCSRGTQCTSGVCSGDGKCGARQNETCSNVAECRTSACQAGVCTEACNSDSDCPSNRYCDANGSLCRPDAPNGAQPNGMACTRGAQCLSGACFTDGSCGKPNGQACGDDLVCRSSVCFSSDTLCGVPNGGACTLDAQCRTSTCISNVCGGPVSDAGADGSPPDGGIDDSGSDALADGGSADATTADGQSDATVAEAGTDGGSVDGGEDATVSDAGRLDASSDGSGISPTDGAMADVTCGPELDCVSNRDAAPQAPNGTSLEGGGISCSTTNAKTAPPIEFGFLVGLVFVRGALKRRRRHSES